MIDMLSYIIGSTLLGYIGLFSHLVSNILHDEPIVLKRLFHESFDNFNQLCLNSCNNATNKIKIGLVPIIIGYILLILNIIAIYILVCVNCYI